MQVKRIIVQNKHFSESKIETIKFIVIAFIVKSDYIYRKKVFVTKRMIKKIQKRIDNRKGIDNRIGNK